VRPELLGNSLNLTSEERVLAYELEQIGKVGEVLSSVRADVFYRSAPRRGCAALFLPEADDKCVLLSIARAHHGCIVAAGASD
jgi:hypothetical protein